MYCIGPILYSVLYSIEKLLAFEGTNRGRDKKKKTNIFFSNSEKYIFIGGDAWTCLGGQTDRWFGRWMDGRTALRTRPDTRLPQSRAGGQGSFLRSLDHLGRRREVKELKNIKKVKCDRWIDRPID